MAPSQVCCAEREKAWENCTAPVVNCCHQMKRHLKNHHLKHIYLFAHFPLPFILCTPFLSLLLSTNQPTLPELNGCRGFWRMERLLGSWSIFSGFFLSNKKWLNNLPSFRTIVLSLLQPSVFNTKINGLYIISATGVWYQKTYVLNSWGVNIISYVRPTFTEMKSYLQITNPCFSPSAQLAGCYSSETDYLFLQGYAWSENSLNDSGWSRSLECKPLHLQLHRKV